MGVMGNSILLKINLNITIVEEELMKLLYYPSIAIPLSELKKYIFYSEEVSTIVPDEFEYYNSDDQNWNESLAVMDYLESEGLYKKSYASEILREYRKPIRTEMLKRIENIETLKEVENGHSPHSWWELYISKLDYDVKEFLIEKKLAKEERDILLVEAEVAAIYMGLLAEYASTYGESLYSTVTNKLYYKELVYKPVINDDIALKLKFSISDILPVPTESTSIDDILKFKNQRKDELSRFQISLSSMQKSLSEINDLREYREKIEKYEKEMLLQISDLKAVLRENNIEFTMNTIDSFLNSPQKIINSFVSGKGFIKISPFVEKIHKTNSLLRNNPIAYLLSAEASGLINIV